MKEMMIDTTKPMICFLSFIIYILVHNIFDSESIFPDTFLFNDFFFLFFSENYSKNYYIYSVWKYYGKMFPCYLFKHKCLTFSSGMFIRKYLSIIPTLTNSISRTVLKSEQHQYSIISKLLAEKQRQQRNLACLIPC